jgi:caffeoyl-CoA O-methyltransferase
VNLDDALAGYVREVFAPEDEVLRAIRERHAREDLPDIFISPEEARIIQVLLRAIGARRVLEVGTLGGYSGVWIARALPRNGTLITIERLPERAAIARGAFRDAGLRDRVEVVEGEALAAMRAREPGFDAVFLDADKAPLPDYFGEAVRLLRVGGLLLCDNTLCKGRVTDRSDREADVEGVREYNRLAAHDGRLVSALIPVRDGLTVSVKVAD